MIYITGDTHGDLEMGRLSFQNFPEGKLLTREDYVIILGDFGFPFLPSDYCEDGTDPDHIRRQQRYRHWIAWLAERPFTVLFLDGNHDNHPFWNHLPAVEWHGGLVNVHPDAPNVMHLKRGELFQLEGHSFWCMGGAESPDKGYRTEGVSWWREEIPSLEEMNHGLEVLERHNYRVDYILTHTMPQTLLQLTLRRRYRIEPTRSYLDEVLARTDFKQWFCGHFHEDRDFPPYKIRVVYDNIFRLI